MSGGLSRWHAAYHNNLAYALHELAAATADTAIQAESVRCQRAAVASSGPDDLDRIGPLTIRELGAIAVDGQDAADADRGRLVPLGVTVADVWEKVGRLAVLVGLEPDDEELDIAALRLAGGLAFLSAYETAVTTANLAHEAVHLTGAFQLAGYQHVVGTLWPVGDQASARLVRDFYAALTVPGGRTVIDVRRAAVALNHATLRLRERYPDWPTFWAGHIHTGP